MNKRKVTAKVDVDVEVDANSVLGKELENLRKKVKSLEGKNTRLQDKIESLKRSIEQYKRDQLAHNRLRGAINNVVNVVRSDFPEEDDYNEIY